MASASVDHMISVTVFLAAILLFSNIFSQTIQTAVIYQQHRSTATKCSDILDSLLLNPGTPPYWALRNLNPSTFGLQDPEFTQYQLSPFALMRLMPTTDNPVYYPQLNTTYSNITLGFGQSLFVPYNKLVNYSTASKLLGLNNTYGFSLTLTPLVSVNIAEVEPEKPGQLKLRIHVTGSGFPLAGAAVNYCFFMINGRGRGSYPTYSIKYNITFADAAGIAYLVFDDFDRSASFLFMAYAHLGGLTGIGYYNNVTYRESFVVPFVSNFETGEVILAHSWDVHAGDNPAEIAFNATFVLLSEDYAFREMPLNNVTGRVVGKLNYGQDPKHAYANLTISTKSSGVLIVTYSKSQRENGAVIMPWGISSLAFPVTFGGDSTNQEWVATDIRQVTVNGIAYQAKFSLWSLEGSQVIGL
ncbi:MAG: hypothetical protein N3D85_03725 [Candidatus Bathyarchaeota archaeon]|nr:hypothetical protein [Candidatus Bathyarchaeota archaeon]